ncbi:MAG: hypothetical protein LAO03_17220 [Acidobacteriia bacterium]|nr:hypothetical protein [Terriglobia bacterium]
MLALRLVRLIESHSEELADGLVSTLHASERTPDLRKVPNHELRSRCHEIYRNLSDWLLTKTEADIEKVYMHLGARRVEQHIPLPQLTWALMLTKEHLWAFLDREGVHGGAQDVFGELELLRSLDQFFDRAVYFAAAGYEDARHGHVA